MWMIFPLLPLLFPTAAHAILEIPSAWATSSSESQLPREWRYCGESGKDLFKIEVISYTPDPVKRGQKLMVRVKGFLEEDIDGGTVDILVAYNGIPLVKDRMDICEALSREPSLPQCPLKRGPWDVKYEGKIPLLLPAGKFSISGTAVNKNGKPISCLEGTTIIGLKTGALIERSSGFKQEISSESFLKLLDEVFVDSSPKKTLWNRQGESAEFLD